MNHARWQSKYSNRHPTKVEDAEDPERSPSITAKLLALDEQQLDMLTRQRAQIYYQDKAGVSRQQKVVDRTETLELNQSTDNNGSEAQTKTFDSRNRQVSLTAVQTALVEG